MIQTKVAVSWNAVLPPQGSKLAEITSAHPFLVTCNNRILLVDGYGIRSIFNSIDMDDERVFGLTWDTTHVYVSAQHAIRKIAATGEVVACYEDYPYDAHQLVAAGKYVYSTITGNDEIIALSPELKPTTIFSATGRFRPPGLPIYQPSSDTKHVNSVWVGADSIWAVYHNNTEPSVAVELRHANKIEKIREIELLSNNAHNVYVEGGILYSCNSKQGKITKYHLSDGSIEQIAIDPEQFGAPPDSRFLRGITRHSDGWIIGASGVARKEDRQKVMSWVYFVDNNFAPIIGFPIPFGCSIYDVRLVAADKAHNGLPFPFDLEDVCD
jgi:hypothetical protein